MRVVMYRIVRFYFNLSYRARTLKRGLTLEEAVAFCTNPERSSETCKAKAGKHRTKMMGPWFDGFVKEE